MTRSAPIQTVFNAGEITPRAFGRTDADWYFRGAADLTNMVVLIEGGAARRPGFEFLRAADDEAVAGRLIAFYTSAGAPRMIEAANLTFRYLNGDTGAVLQSSGSDISTTTPYSGAALPGLYTWQEGDVMWITHADAALQPRTLKYAGDTSWTLGAFAFKDGPFLPQNTSAITLTPSAVTGNITLTASAPLFSAAHIGARFRLQQNLGSPPYRKWKPEEGYRTGPLDESDEPTDEPLAADEIREYAGRVYQTSAGGVCGNQPPVHEEGTVSDGGVDWTYLHDGAGVVLITGVTNNQTASATVESRLPAASATKYWSEGAFSPARGWPRIGNFVESRLAVMSTLAQPDTFFASRTAEYTPDDASFKERAGSGEVLDDDAIQRTIADGRVNVPSWMVNFNQLTVGMPGAIKRLAGPSPDEPMSPAGMVARNFALRGVARRIRAISTGETLIAPTKDRRRILEIRADGAQRDLTALAEHSGASPCARLAWCGEPHRRLFRLNQDGRLWCLAYDPAQDVTGWTPFTFGGSFLGGMAQIEDIEALEDSTGEDRLWCIVRLTVNGASRRYVCRLTPDWRGDRNTRDENCKMDAAVRFDRWNASAATVTLALTGGGTGAHGETVALTGAGGTPFAGRSPGDILHLRSAAHRGDARMTLLTVDSDTAATALLISGAAAAHIGIALTGWAFASATVGGLSHLEGESVLVQADGAQYGPFTVAAGAVTLPAPAAAGWAGLPVPWRILSMPVDPPGARGATSGRRRKLERAALRVFEAGEGELRVVAPDGRVSQREVIAPRDEQDIMGAAPRLRTEVISLSPENGFEEDSQIEAFGAGAHPFTLLSAALDMAADD